jgi:hypothetical protein
MELGGVVMDAGGGAAELGLLGGGSSRLLKHGRGNAAAGAEEHGWGGRAVKQARTAADVAEAAKAAVTPFLLGSCSPGHGGEQMLSFSSVAASSCASTASVAAAAAAVAADGAMPLYYGTPASCSGEHGGVHGHRCVWRRWCELQSFFSVACAIGFAD